MAFITLSRGVNPKWKLDPKWRPRSLYKTMKIGSCGRCFRMHHFLVDWEEFRRTESLRIRTSLLTFSIGKFKVPFARSPSPAERAIRTSPRTLFVSYNSNHAKRAHSQTFGSTLRERIWRVLNASPLEGTRDNLVSLFLSSFAVFASPEDVELHLRACLDKYMSTVGSGREARSGKEARGGREARGRQRDFFHVLFPFSLEKWGDFGEARRSFESMHGAQGLGMFNIYLCHHYRIRTSLRLADLRADLEGFRLMLQKFNFIDAISKIEFANERQAAYRSKRLVRILKWRTLESEQYLIFLLNEFGTENVLQTLTLFEKLCAAYRPAQALP